MACAGAVQAVIGALASAVTSIVRSWPERTPRPITGGEILEASGTRSVSATLPAPVPGRASGTPGR